MSEEIKIAKKSKSAYVSACLYAFDHDHNSVTLSALGSQVAKAFDVSEKVVQVLDKANEVKTEQFEADGLLGVRITLTGGKK